MQAFKQIGLNFASEFSYSFEPVAKVLYKINTSNKGKLSEYKRFFGGKIEAEARDLPEPDSDQLTIIRYKASQFDGVIVDDVSLEVDGADVGANIKWYLTELDQFVGKPAKFVCLIGVHKDSQVRVYKGEVSGELVSKRGESYGFNPYFQPTGHSKTLAEDCSDEVNARYWAVKALLEDKPFKVCDALYNWDGKFQSENG